MTARWAGHAMHEVPVDGRLPAPSADDHTVRTRRGVRAIRDRLPRAVAVGLRASARALCRTGALALLVGGCASRTVDAPAGPAVATAGVSVIQSDSFRFAWETQIDPVGVDLERCTQQAIADRLPSLHIVPHAELATALTPGLPPGAAPLSMTSLRVLLGEPKFREAVDRLLLRYIVIVAGDTEIAADHAWLAGAAFGAPAVMGVSTWKKRTGVSAVILDLGSAGGQKELEAESSGESWVGGILPLVVGYRANTEERACREIADQITEALARDMQGVTPP